MALNSDRDGFLIPETPLNRDDVAQGIRGVKRNTDVILSLLRGRARALDRARIVNPNSQRSASGPVPRQDAPRTAASQAQDGGGRAASSATGAAAIERARDSRGRFIAQPGQEADQGAAAERQGARQDTRAITEVAGAVRQLTRQQAQQAAERTRAEESQRRREGDASRDQTRDARGRFGSGGGAGESEAEKDGAMSRLKKLFEDAKSPVSLGDVDKVDPVIESANEIMGMVGGAVGALKTTGELGRAVLGRGFNSSQRDRTTPWYRKILQQLKLMRRDDGEFQRAELRVLNDQHRPGAGGRGGAGGAGGLGGMAGNLLSNILPGGAMGALRSLGPLAAKLALPVAAITSAVKSLGTSTDEYADRMGVKNDGGVGKELAIRGAGVMQDLGNTLTFGLADKLGKSKAVSTVVEKTASGLGAAKDWVLGKTSKLFESGKRGAGAVSTGKGDKGGVSYGTYQMSSTQGVADKFVKGSKYAKEFEGLKSGTPEFSAKWKQIAKADPAFEAAQHDFIQKTHYDPQVAKLQKGGIDLSGRGAAVQDAIWSTSVQFGGKSSLIQAALKGKDVGKMSDKDIVSAIQDYKIANNDALFKNSDAKTRAGTLARASAEKDRLIKLAEAPDAPTSATAAPVPAAASAAPPPGGAPSVQPPEVAAPGSAAPAAIPAVKPAPLVLGLDKIAGASSGAAPVAGVPSAATPGAVPSVAAAPVPAALSGSARMPAITVSAQVPPPPSPRADAPMPLSSKQPLEVTVRNDRMAGQDVKDRRLAHIATGGMAST